MAKHFWCSIGRSFGANEILLRKSLFCLLGWAGLPSRGLVLESNVGSLTRRDPLRGQCEAGSLTGAVHLSNDNAGVPRPAHLGRKPRVEQKGKSWLDFSLQYGAKNRNVGLSILFISEFEERGVRKVTTGITGLWPPSIHSDVAF